MEVTEITIDTNDIRRISVYSEPNLNSEIVCTIEKTGEILIDLANSTKDFYKVYTAFGAEGFCQKDFIILKE